MCLGDAVKSKLSARGMGTYSVAAEVLAVAEKMEAARGELVESRDWDRTEGDRTEGDRAKGFCPLPLGGRTAALLNCERELAKFS